MKLHSKRDMLLMTYFRNNARENLTRISRLTSIPVSTIFDRLREFEKDLVYKHTTLVDFRKLGFDIRVNILLKLPKENRDEFKEYIIKCENINSIFKINNGFDYLIEGIFRDMNEFHDFMERIERFNILNKQELFILEDLKREGFLSDKTHAELLYTQ